VISSSGEQLGIMSTQKALSLADEEGLDLVEVSPTARPPVCRIMDYGKYKYEKSKRAKQSKKKQHSVQLKEIKLRPKTEEHDYQFKKRHAEEFLSKHDKVKFTVFFRGREFDHPELGHRVLSRMRDELSHVAAVEKPASFEGRVMTMIMAPLQTKTAQRPKQTGAPEEQTRRPVVSERAAPRRDDREEPGEQKEGRDAEAQVE
jgi:translation initiation factor IF-3